MDKEDILECVLHCIIVVAAMLSGYGIGYYKGVKNGRDQVVQQIVEEPKYFIDVLNRIESETKKQKEEAQ